MRFLGTFFAGTALGWLARAIVEYVRTFDLDYDFDLGDDND